MMKKYLYPFPTAIFLVKTLSLEDRTSLTSVFTGLLSLQVSLFVLSFHQLAIMSQS